MDKEHEHEIKRNASVAGAASSVDDGLELLELPGWAALVCGMELLGWARIG